MFDWLRSLGTGFGSSGPSVLDPYAYDMFPGESQIPGLYSYGAGPDVQAGGMGKYYDPAQDFYGNGTMAGLEDANLWTSDPNMMAKPSGIMGALGKSLGAASEAFGGGGQSIRSNAPEGAGGPLQADYRKFLLPFIDQIMRVQPGMLQRPFQGRR